MHINKNKRHIISVICCVISLMLATSSVYAEESPYQSYNYDYWEDTIASPAPYKPIKSISGKAIGTTEFSLPTDIFVTSNGDIYICDSENNRIVLMTKDMQLIKIIDSFDNNGRNDTFNKPQGIFVARSNDIYVADTGNNRVVKISQDNKLVVTYSVEKDDTLPSGFVFEPLKVCVDQAGRVYVIAKNIFEGMLNFMPDGEYMGFFGTIKVSVNAADLFWRSFSTREQREKMKLYVPTEFSGLDIDDDGFVYTTDIDIESVQSIKRFNPSSKNIIKNYHTAINSQRTDLIGDMKYPLESIFKGRSSLVDIEYKGEGMYTVLDNKRGRVITYDEEGSIAYIFSGIGSQLGMFKKPVAIESYEDKLYVLDQTRNQLVIFEATEYGKLINQAISLRYSGDEASAVECWEKVIRLDSSCILANVGIGKSLLAQNKNKEAMHYLKKGMDKANYSVALKRYRTDMLKIVFPYIIIAIGVAVVSVNGIKWYKKARTKHDE